uniref:Uncharacterized protein n=1 Tax=Vitis vinifera TaxID=29760 RepID=A5AYF4_VITVI|nr:hypothetical protein VITISV_002038 [Vitis vinifera]
MKRKVERRLDRIPDVGHLEKVEGRRTRFRIRIPDARHPDGNGSGRRIPSVRHPDEMVAEKDSGCETSEWKWRRRRIPDRGIPNMRHPDGNDGGEELRVWDTQMEKATVRDSGCETPGWKWRRRGTLSVGYPDGKGGGEGFRVRDTDSSLAVAVAMAPFDSGFDPRQRRHLIRAHLVSQLICVQLVLLD